MDGPGFTASLVVSAGLGWVAECRLHGSRGRSFALAPPSGFAQWSVLVSLAARSRGKPGGAKKTCFQSQAGPAGISE